MTIRFYKTLFLVATLGLLQACTNVDTRRADQDIEAGKTEVKENTDSARARGKLGDGYKERYHLTGKLEDLRNAISHYDRALKMEPLFTGAHIARYSALVNLAMKTQASPDLQRVKVAWEQSDELRRLPVMPPATVEALLQIRKDDDLKLANIRPLLRKALRENPRNPTAAILLGDSYLQENKHRLASTAYEQALKAGSESVRLHVRLAGTYMDTRLSKRCPASAKSYNRATQLIKKVLKVSPENAALHLFLADAYQGAGKYPLYLYEAKSALRLDESDEEAKGTYLDALYFNGQFDKFFREGPSLLGASLFNSETNEHQGLINLVRGNYRESRNKLSAHKVEGENAFSWFYESLAVQGEHDVEVARAVLKKIPAKLLKADPWLNEVYDYRMGKLGGDELFGKAKNACEKVEAEFFRGFDAWFSGDKLAAKQHWGEVKRYNIGRFLENMMARQMLKRVADSSR